MISPPAGADTAPCCPLFRRQNTTFHLLCRMLKAAQYVLSVGVLVGERWMMFSSRVRLSVQNQAAAPTFPPLLQIHASLPTHFIDAILYTLAIPLSPLSPPESLSRLVSQEDGFRPLGSGRTSALLITDRRSCSDQIASITTLGSDRLRIH